MAVCVAGAVPTATAPSALGATHWPHQVTCTPALDRSSGRQISNTLTFPQNRKHDAGRASRAIFATPRAQRRSCPSSAPTVAAACRPLPRVLSTGPADDSSHLPCDCGSSSSKHASMLGLAPRWCPAARRSSLQDIVVPRVYKHKLRQSGSSAASPTRSQLSTGTPQLPSCLATRAGCVGSSAARCPECCPLARLASSAAASAAGSQPL